ncbi:hypothetical protein Bbelb_074660 [Branchiostoma belcheri]|nr:hypothetical protein Bbelb_074660 [Branchiostoma belcheri]
METSTATNGVLSSQDTSRLASIAQEKRIAVLKEFCRKNPDSFSRSVSRNGPGSVEATSGDLPPVTFSDFIWSIVNRRYLNIHWEPFFSLCAPCQVQYDFIAHTDTLPEDLRLFFHRSGIVGKDGLLPKERPSRAKSRFGTTFLEIPTEDVRRIGEIYKPDFDMFGYSFDDDLALIKTNDTAQ